MLQRCLFWMFFVFLLVNAAPRFVWSEIPKTGQVVPEMASFDKVAEDLLNQYKVPGASVAVVKDGRLVFARGYGFSDVEKQQPVQPDALFRVASISKPITAVAVLRLVEEGKLKLDDKAFTLLSHLQPASGETLNPDLKNITILQLLHHSGGWDRNKSSDPMFRSDQIAEAMKVPGPSSCETVIRYMLSQPLDFPSGTGYAYSNFGYCVLGRVIEKVTGQTYEAYVKQAILVPMGITGMRIGRTLVENQAPGEVKYYHYPGGTLAKSVFPGVSEMVPWPYGGFHLEAMDAHGGWIASAIDLVRFISGVDNRPTLPDVLKQETIQKMIARPEPPLWKDSAYHYGMGWLVRPVGQEANWWHDGSLPGTVTLMVRTHHGYAWSILFNSRPQDTSLLSAADEGLWVAFSAVKQWPTHDLFSSFGYKTQTQEKQTQEVPPQDDNTPTPEPAPSEPNPHDAASSFEPSDSPDVADKDIAQNTDKNSNTEPVQMDTAPGPGGCQCNNAEVSASYFVLLLALLCFVGLRRNTQRRQNRVDGTT